MARSPRFNTVRCNRGRFTGRLVFYAVAIGELVIPVTATLSFKDKLEVETALQPQAGGGDPDVRNRKQLPVWRNLVQGGLAVFLLFAGWRFARFVAHFQSYGAEPLVRRPPSVEGFLPIGALVALKSWLATGVFDRVHPAGLVLLLLIIGVSFLYRKGFCSWLCPVGLASEALGRMGSRLPGTRLPYYLDRGLMVLKYLILAFFLKVIFLDLDGLSATAFLASPYYKIADVKMLLFFQNLSRTAAMILGALALLSLVVRNFWCRYLCPYGALLGVVSLASPVHVRREPELCTGCRLCDRACPNRIEVSRTRAVQSPECTGCLDCLAACPHRGALELQVAGMRQPLRPSLFPILLLATFVAVVALASLAGYWQTSLTYAEYRQLIPRATFFGHP